MKKAVFINPAQQGFSLIEAMVSIVLVAILGLGLAYATSRVLQVQRFATTQNLAVIRMREYLQTTDTPQVMVADKAVTISDSQISGNVIVGIAGTEKIVSMPIRSRSLKISSTELFSGDGKISLAY